MKAKKAFFVVLLLLFISLAGISYYYRYVNANYVTTEDAYIDGTVLKVGPQILGQLLEVRVREGDRVAAGEVLARVDDAALSPGGNTELTLTKAPIAGVVLKVLSHPGEVVAPGQAVVFLADPQSVYLSVNVEEKLISKVRPGQRVEFTVDAIPGRAFSGTVAEITDAVSSTFSLLPTRSTSGSFIKVSQRIPLKVVVDNVSQAPFRLGMSAGVRIFIRG